MARHYSIARSLPKKQLFPWIHSGKGQVKDTYEHQGSVSQIRRSMICHVLKTIIIRPGLILAL